MKACMGTMTVRFRLWLGTRGVKCSLEAGTPDNVPPPIREEVDRAVMRNSCGPGSAANARTPTTRVSSGGFCHRFSLKGWPGSSLLVTRHPGGSMMILLALRPESWMPATRSSTRFRSEEHTSELQSQFHLVCRLLLE